MNRFSTEARRGPLPKLCDGCKLATGVQIQAPAPAPLPFVRPGREPAVVRTPFNSTPTTAPVPPAARPDDVPAELGPVERQLAAELAAMRSVNPTAGTQATMALKLARAADQADPSDIKSTLAVAKELRAILDSLNKSPQGGDDDDDDSLFGAVRPQVVNPPAV